MKYLPLLLLAACTNVVGSTTAEDAAELAGAAHRARPHIAMRAAPTPLCPGACTIMPLGDSITDGGGSGGYRAPLWDLTHATFVGSLAGGPALVDGTSWPRDHEGHAGWVIDAPGYGLQAIAADRIAAYHPDVVLLMIGTNDVNLGFDDGAPARLERLVGTLAGTTVVLSTILPTQDPAQNVRVDAFNGAVPGIAARTGARFVDIHAVFDPALLVDRLHPTAAGYAVIAREWASALR